MTKLFRLSTITKSAKRLMLVPFLMLLLLMSGCHRLSTVSPPMPPSTPIIELSTPLPADSYSKNVADQLQDWQKRLMDTSTTSDSCKTPDAECQAN